MLYAVTHPEQQFDRIRLFPSREAARQLHPCPGPVRSVAVDYDDRMRRVVPLQANVDPLDPTWSTPAQPHPDGSVTAKGPIPQQLFLS